MLSNEGIVVLVLVFVAAVLVVVQLRSWKQAVGVLAEANYRRELGSAIPQCTPSTAYYAVGLMGLEACRPT